MLEGVFLIFVFVLLRRCGPFRAPGATGRGCHRGSQFDYGRRTGRLRLQLAANATHQRTSLPSYDYDAEQLRSL